MKAKTTRRALLISALSLLLCVSMLVGTTFAWFTDSVTSGRNTIQAGNLDVVLEYWDGDSYEEVTSTTKLFDDAALWEPGYTEVAYLKVSNAGSLALKYQLAVNVYNETDGKTKDGTSITLSDHLQFKVVESDTDLADTYTRETAQNAEATATKLQTYNSEVKPLDAKNEAGDNNYYDYVALIIYMPETVGNEANHDGVNIPSIEMGVNLLATQQTAESDSFDNQYDADAEILVVDKSAAIVNNNGILGETVVLTADMLYGTIKVTVPAGAQLSSADVSSLKLTVKNAESDYYGTLAANQVATGYEIYVDGIADDLNPFVAEYGNLYNYEQIIVELPIGAGRNDVKVYKDGMTLYGTAFDDDAGVVTFKTESFTPFGEAQKSNITVVYTKPSVNEKALIEAIENLNGNPGTVTFKSTTDDMVSVNNIADSLNGTSGITLVGETKEDPIIKANNATITAESLTIKHTTIQATGTTTIKGNNTTIEDLDYQHAVGSYGLTVSGSNATVKDTTISGVASQGLVILDATTSSAATISGSTIIDSSAYGTGSGIKVTNLNGTVDVDNSTIRAGWALHLGAISGGVRGTVDINKTNIDSTGLTVRNVVEANFTEVTFANTWSAAALSFEIGGTTNTFTGCDFQTAVNFMRCGTVNRTLTFNFNNCTYNGTAITAENIATYLNFSGVAAVNTITVYVNGTAVTL